MAVRRRRNIPWTRSIPATRLTLDQRRVVPRQWGQIGADLATGLAQCRQGRGCSQADGLVSISNAGILF